MVARQLCAVRGVAEISAAVFSAELFGTRTFRNGRQLGAVLGLVAGVQYDNVFGTDQRWENDSGSKGPQFDDGRDEAQASHARRATCAAQPPISVQTSRFCQRLAIKLPVRGSS
mgnify:CR=1 FL=1